MINEQLQAFEKLLNQKLEPLLEQNRQQSAQIELLQQQLDEQASQTLDSLDHINSQLQGKQVPPVPISEAWQKLGFKSEVALRGAIRRGTYKQEQGEVLRRGTSILVNVEKCLENGFTPIHRRQSQRSA